MIKQTENILTMDGAVQDFLKAAHMADEEGYVTIMDKNRPAYILFNISALQEREQASDEEVLLAARRIIDKNREALEVLAR